MSEWDALLQKRLASLDDTQKRKLVLHIDAIDTPSPLGIASQEFLKIVESVQMPSAIFEQLQTAIKTGDQNPYKESP